MFDSIAASLLTKLFGDYIEGLNSKNLNLGVTSGKIKLQRLNLKKTILEPLELPITVKDGFLESLQMNIPWTNLNKKSTVVTLKGIYLLVGPQVSFGNEQEVEERMFNTKKRSLEIAEAVGLTEEDEKVEAKKSDKKTGYFEGIVMNVVDNLQVNLEDIHIRYEDEEKGFSFGISLESAHLMTPGQDSEDWDPNESIGANIMKKILSFARLGFYFNMNSEFCGYDSMESFGTSMKQIMMDQNNSYILNPTSAKVKLNVNLKENDLTRPKVILKAIMEITKFDIHKKQFDQILELINYLTSYANHYKFSKYRPNSSTPIEEPESWWIYLLNTTKENILKQNEKWSFAYYKARNSARKKYIDIYKRKKLEKKVSQKEIEEKNQIERFYSFDDIITWRKLTNALILKEKSAEKNEPKQGFFSSFLSPKKEKRVKKEITMRELYDTIEFDEEKLESLPPDYKQIEAHVSLVGGILNLYDEESVQIIHGSFQNIGVDLGIYSECLDFNLNLEQLGIVGNDNGKHVSMLDIDHSTENTPLLEFQLSLSPLEKDVDIYTAIIIKPLNILYNKNIVERILKFVDSEEEIPIEDLVSSNLDMVKNQAQSAIKYALGEREKIEIDFDIKAPTILIPNTSSRSEKYSYLVVDLGRLSIKSDLASRENSIQKSGSDISIGEDYFYDSYYLDIEKLNAYFASEDMLQRNQIIDNFDINVAFKLRVIPTIDLPFVITNIDLKGIDIRLTEKALFNLLDVAQTFQLEESENKNDKITPPSEEGLDLHMIDFLPVDQGVLLDSLPMFSGKFSMGYIHLGYAKSENSSNLFDVNLQSLVADIDLTTTSVNLTVNLSKIEILNDSDKIIHSNSSNSDVESFITVSYRQDEKNEFDVASLKVDGLTLNAKKETLVMLASESLLLLGVLEVEMINFDQNTTEETVVKVDEITKMKIDISMNKVEVILLLESPILTFDAQDLNFSVSLNGEAMEIKGYLGDLHCLDAFEDNAWNNVISIDGERVFSFEYIAYDKNAYYPGFDSSIDINMTSINGIVMGNTFISILDFVKPFQSILESASNALVDEVSTNTPDLMKMNIHISNPIIRVPVSSTSNEFLLLDFGNISLSNHFSEEFTIDNTKITVSDIKILSGTSGENQIVQNGNIDVSMIHYIYDESVADNIDINVGSFDFILHRNTLNVLINIFNLNISPLFLKLLEEVNTENIELATTSTAEEQEVELKERDSIMNVVVDSLNVIFTSDISGILHLTLPDARVEYKTIGNVMTVDASLKDFELVDVRETKGVIDRLISTQSSGEKGFITFSMESVETVRNVIDIKIGHLIIAPIPSVIVEFLEYLMPLNEAVGVLINTLSTLGGGETPVEIKSEDVTTPTELKCVILSPYLHIFETFDKKSSNAFILNLGSILVDVNSTSEASSVNVALTEFELVSGFYDYDAKKSLHSTHMIQPVSATIDIMANKNTTVVNVDSNPVSILISYEDFLGASLLLDRWDNHITRITNLHIDIPEETPEETEIIFQNQNIYFSMERFSISILDDRTNARRIKPVLNAYFEKIDVQNIGNEEYSQISIEIKTIGIDSFNSNFNVWESALEPLSFVCSVAMAKETTNISLDTDIIYFNFSTVIVDNLFEIASSSKILLERNFDGKERKIKQVRYDSPYVVINHTGFPFTMNWNGEDLYISDLEVYPLMIKEISRSDVMDSNQENIIEPDFGELFNIHEVFDIDTVGVTIIPQCFETNPSLRLSCEVYNESGSDIMMFRSPYTIHNNLKEDIWIKVVSDNEQPFIAKLNSNSKHGVPLLYTSSKFSFSVRTGDSTWMDWIDESESIISEETAWKCNVTQKKKRFNGYIDTTISLNSPFKFENGFATPILLHTICHSNIDNQYTVLAGDILDLSMSIVQFTFKLPGFNWSEKINPNSESQTIFLADDQSKVTKVNIESLNVNGSVFIAVYSKYWILNNTGLPLRYKSPTKKDLQAGQYHFMVKDIFVGDQEHWYEEPLQHEYYGIKGTKNIFYYGSEKIQVIAPDLGRSEDIPLSSVNGLFTINGVAKKYNFTTSVTIGKKSFWRTSIVRLYPAFVIVNNLERELFIQQDQTPAPLLLEPGTQIPYHWPKKTSPETLRISVDDSNYSQSFKITDLGKFKLRNCDELLEISIVNDSGITYVIFDQNTAHFPEYIIRNETDMTFICIQEKCSTEMRIESHSEKELVWENPQGSKRLKFYYLQGSNLKDMKSINMESIRKHSPIIIAKKSIGREIIIDHLKHILILSENMENEEKILEIVSMTLTLGISGIGISFMSDMNNQIELFYLSLDKINLEYKVSDYQTYINFMVGSLQIDNQLFLTPYPVLLYSPESKKKFLSFSVVLKNTDFDHVTYVRYLGILVQEMDICIDQIFLIYLLNFAASATSKIQTLLSINEMEDIIKGQYVDVRSLYHSEQEDLNFLYFEDFIINSGRATISFATAVRRSYDMDPSTLDWIFTVAGFLANTERTPFLIQGLYIKNAFSSQDEFIERVSTYYISSFLRQSYRIIGNMDFLGSPVSLIDSLGTGVVSFVTEPAKGIVSSPEDFALGVAKGTGSLVKNTIYGVFNSATKITGTVALIGETLTFDDDYRRKREISKQKEARHVGEGLAFGARDLGKGIFSGITGLVTEPIKGGKKEGAFGVLKGIGKGLTGVVLKPAIGVVDVATRTTEGIKNTTTFFDNLNKERKRYPRYFGEIGSIIKYEEHAAHGQYLLRIIDSGKYNDDHYISHIWPKKSKNECVLLSEKYLFKLKKNMNGSYVVCWKSLKNKVNVQVMLDKVIFVQIYNALNIKMTKKIVFSDDSILEEALLIIFSKITILDNNNNETRLKDAGVTNSPSSLRKVEPFEGWLYKRGAEVKSWRKRWFTLSNGEMSYKKKKTGRIMGSFSVRGNSIKTSTIDKKFAAFEINTGDRTYYCYAENEIDQQTWINKCHHHGAVFQ